LTTAESKGAKFMNPNRLSALVVIILYAFVCGLLSTEDAENKPIDLIMQGLNSMSSGNAREGASAIKKNMTALLSTCSAENRQRLIRVIDNVGESFSKEKYISHEIIYNSLSKYDISRKIYAIYFKNKIIIISAILWDRANEEIIVEISFEVGFANILDNIKYFKSNVGNSDIAIKYDAVYSNIIGSDHTKLVEGLGDLTIKSETFSIDKYIKAIDEVTTISGKIESCKLINEKLVSSRLRVLTHMMKCEKTPLFSMTLLYRIDDAWCIYDGKLFVMQDYVKDVLFE
jgi:hypothetical protein